MKPQKVAGNYCVFPFSSRRKQGFRQTDDTRSYAKSRISKLFYNLMIAIALSIPVLATDVAAAQDQFVAAIKPANVRLPDSSSMNVILGKSVLLKLPTPITRVSVGRPETADVTTISPSEVYVLGKAIGTTNIIVWKRNGQTEVINVTVVMDAAALQSKLQELMPREQNIRVSAAGDSLVLSGTVSDTIKVDRAVALADAHVRAATGAGSGGIQAGQGMGQGSGQGTGEGGESQGASGAGQGLGSIRVINMLQVASNQQVMLEVKVAEINRTVAEKLGFDFQRAARKAGSAWTQIMTGIIGGAPGQLFQSANPNIGDSFLIDAQKRDELIKILAEPNIVAISGQEASFIVGGEVMIPIPQFGGLVTLQSRQFGVGLKFTPTVLEENRINLIVSPEVTELVKFETVATTGLGGILAVPTFTTRRISTTVQLREGQSLAIGGLLQDNIREQVNRFPVLGEIPVLGALFRSSDFQKEKTELMVVVTPHLMKPLSPDYKLPTDAFVEPSRSEFLLEGKMEGSPPKEPRSREELPIGAPSQEAPSSGGVSREEPRPGARTQ